MAERPISAALPPRAVALASSASLLFPLGALVLIGLSERATALFALSNSTLVGVSLAAAVPGLAVGVGAFLADSGPASRWRAALGVATSALVLVVVGVASLSGAASARETERALGIASEISLRSFAGWNGGAVLDGAGVFASEVDPRSELGKILLRSYDQPFRLLLVGVDNRGGDHDVVLDLKGARLHRANGTLATSLAPSAPPTLVAAGTRFGGVPAIFASGESFVDVQSIDVRLGGVVQSVPGRYFTVEDKRAIDARRPSPRQ